MRKLLSLVAVGLISTMWVGCGLIEDTDNASITLTTTTLNATVTGSSNTVVNVVGSVSASPAPVTLSAEILTAADAAVPSSQIEVSVTQPGTDKEDFEIGSGKEAQIAVTVKPGTPNATYKLKITVKAGTVSSEKSVSIVVGGGSAGTKLTLSSPVILGAQENSIGSSLDLDAATPTALTSAEAKAAGTKADIVYAYSTLATSAGPVIMSPSYAKNSSGITAFASWATPSATTFRKVTPDITTITAEELEALHASSTSDRIVVAQGDILVVKTSESKYVLIRMDAVSADGNGTATVVSAK